MLSFRNEVIQMQAHFRQTSVSAIAAASLSYVTPGTVCHVCVPPRLSSPGPRRIGQGKQLVALSRGPLPLFGTVIIVVVVITRLSRLSPSHVGRVFWPGPSRRSWRVHWQLAELWLGQRGTSP